MPGRATSGPTGLGPSGKGTPARRLKRINFLAQNERGQAASHPNRETALPSRIRVKLPADIAEQIETARRSYHRFGDFSEALGQIRARVERERWSGDNCAAFAGTSVSQGTSTSARAEMMRLAAYCLISNHTNRNDISHQDSGQHRLIRLGTPPAFPAGSPLRVIPLPLGLSEPLQRAL